MCPTLHHFSLTYKPESNGTMEVSAPEEMYATTNTTYGIGWEAGQPFNKSFTHSTPYKSLTNRGEVKPTELPRDRNSLSLTHNPRHPCGIMSMSNVPTNTRGEFTNVRRDLYADSQVSKTYRKNV